MICGTTDKKCCFSTPRPVNCLPYSTLLVGVQAGFKHDPNNCLWKNSDGILEIGFISVTNLSYSRPVMAGDCSMTSWLHGLNIRMRLVIRLVPYESGDSPFSWDSYIFEWPNLALTIQATERKTITLVHIRFARQSFVRFSCEKNLKVWEKFETARKIWNCEKNLKAWQNEKRSSCSSLLDSPSYSRTFFTTDSSTSPVTTSVEVDANF